MGVENKVQCDWLAIDEACLKISSVLHLDIFQQLEECEKCNYQLGRTILPNETKWLTLSTEYPYNFYYDLDNKVQCQKQYKFEEYGVYGWNLTDKGCPDIHVITQPMTAYLPIICAALVYLLIIIIWRFGKYIYHSRREAQRKSDLESPATLETPSGVVSDVVPVTQPKARVRSLDTFRGISIAIMIFVNHGGGRYWFFSHSVWNGLTVADLVFPWFLWIMGVSLTISLHSQLRSSVPRHQILLRVVKRSIILIALGIIIYSSTYVRLKYLRIPGVLQRIGLSYFIVAAIEIAFMKPQLSVKNGRSLVIRDILDSWVQWLIILALTTMYVVIVFFLPVPGCPTGYLGPGGDHNNGTAQNCTGGATGYIDRVLLGSHLRHCFSCGKIYRAYVRYDDSGLLGTLTSVLLVFLGVHAGRILLKYQRTSMKILRWCVWSLIIGIIAGELCGFSKNDGVIPLNRKLWSLSFVLATASMAFLLQSILYFIIDDKQWWSGAPFYYAGMNAIVLYIGHMLTTTKFPWKWKPEYDTHAEWLAMNLWGTTLWIMIAFLMYRKKTFISL